MRQASVCGGAQHSPTAKQDLVCGANVNVVEPAPKRKKMLDRRATSIRFWWGATFAKGETGLGLRSKHQRHGTRPKKEKDA